VLPEVSDFVDIQGAQCVRCVNDDGVWYFKRSDGGLNGHRVDGPAVVFSDGAMLWRINDVDMHSSAEFQRAAGVSDEDMIMLILKYGPISS
jgi:hypothetical protein